MELKIMTNKTLQARTVARALEKKLEVADTSVHWVSVIGEPNSWGPATVNWPADPDAMLSVMVQEGISEGTIVLVCETPQRTQPEQMTPLLRIKMLGGRRKVCSELPVLLAFLDDVQGEVDRMLAAEAARQSNRELQAA